VDPGRLDCDDPAGVPAPSGRVPVVVVRARDPRSGKQWRTSMRTQAKSLQIQFLKTGKSSCFARDAASRVRLTFNGGAR
jgi:hypothetical protein